MRLEPSGALAFLGALFVSAGGIGLLSIEKVSGQLAVLAACEAVDAEDWPAVLAGTENRVGPDETGRAAVECRCRALLATASGDACITLLDGLAADPSTADWTPDPELAIHWIQTRRDAGDGVGAAFLARRAARSHPSDPDLFYLELVTRSSVEPEEDVLEELANRIPSTGSGVTRMRASVARRQLRRGDPKAALSVLGDAPPESEDAPRSLWFDTRGMAFAMAGDLDGVRRSYDQWAHSGGDPAELTARYALTLSIAGLGDPDASPIERLSRALAACEHVADATLHQAVATRLILTLVDADRGDEAIALYDQYRTRFDFHGLSRDELERSSEYTKLAGRSGDARSGTLHFTLPETATGGQLLLSPEPDAPVDAAYEVFPVDRSLAIEARRRAGIAPQRWVLRNASGDTLASGTVTPRPGAPVEISVRDSGARPHLSAALSRRPADGHRRVALLLLDCGDWRIVRYLRARGELPVLGALLERGFRAVLDSDPPLTAAALEALVHPGRRSGASFFGLVHELGVELAGLSSVGENPFAALEWMLPDGADLFSEIGAGDRSAANLLFAHGGMRAGRHSEVVGPGGVVRRNLLATSARDLNARERRDFPRLAAVTEERDAIHLRTIAAEFDAALDLVRQQSLDLFALRIEPLDILTHAHFAGASTDGQDDGHGLLFSTYRYIDSRLGPVHNAMDEDDILIVMSDHGIRTSMEHSRDALFVATGAGVPAGRARGRPALRGVSRVIADVLGVETAWPDTGVAPWAATLPPARPVAFGAVDSGAVVAGAGTDTDAPGVRATR